LTIGSFEPSVFSPRWQSIGIDSFHLDGNLSKVWRKEQV